MLKEVRDHHRYAMLPPFDCLSSDFNTSLLASRRKLPERAVAEQVLY